jgi:hypothetical protein
MRIRDPGWRQFGSGIRDGKKSDPGYGINIPDPQHCLFGSQAQCKFSYQTVTTFGKANSVVFFASHILGSHHLRPGP